MENKRIFKNGEHYKYIDTTNMIFILMDVIAVKEHNGIKDIYFEIQTGNLVTQVIKILNYKIESKGSNVIHFDILDAVFIDDVEKNTVSNFENNEKYDVVLFYSLDGIIEGFEVLVDMSLERHKQIHTEYNGRTHEICVNLNYANSLIGKSVDEIRNFL